MEIPPWAAGLLAAGGVTLGIGSLTMISRLVSKAEGWEALFGSDPTDQLGRLVRGCINKESDLITVYGDTQSLSSLLDQLEQILWFDPLGRDIFEIVDKIKERAECVFVSALDYLGDYESMKVSLLKALEPIQMNSGAYAYFLDRHDKEGAERVINLLSESGQDFSGLSWTIENMLVQKITHCIRPLQ